LVEVVEADHPIRWRQKDVGWAKNAIFNLSTVISQKRRKLGLQLLLITNSKSHMPCPLVPKSMTLRDLERQFRPHERNFRYFPTFGRRISATAQVTAIVTILLYFASYNIYVRQLPVINVKASCCA